MSRRVGAYRAAIQWIADNDDTDWLRLPPPGDEPIPSVTLCLVADVFGRSLDEATADLRLALKRDGREVLP